MALSGNRAAQVRLSQACRENLRRPQARREDREADRGEERQALGGIPGGMKFTALLCWLRPPSLNEETFNPTRWQVIHLHSGLRLSYQQLGSSKTRADAKRSALAEIERVAKDKGWKWTRAMILDTKSRPK